MGQVFINRVYQKRLQLIIKNVNTTAKIKDHVQYRTNYFSLLFPVINLASNWIIRLDTALSVSTALIDAFDVDKIWVDSLTGPVGSVTDCLVVIKIDVFLVSLLRLISSIFI